jgi:hypothetical protein
MIRWGEVIRDGRRGGESGCSETGEIPLGKLLNGGNHIPEFLPFFGEMILDTRQDLQEGSPLHKPHSTRFMMRVTMTPFNFPLI